MLENGGRGIVVTFVEGSKRHTDRLSDILDSTYIVAVDCAHNLGKGTAKHRPLCEALAAVVYWLCTFVVQIVQVDVGRGRWYR